jgi:hypothetical protein
MLEEKKDTETTSDEELSFEVDPRDFSKHWQYLKKREHIPLGVAAGVGAAIAALIIWALLIKLTGYKVGWMAIAASFGIGFAIQYFGKGVSPVFGMIGGGIAFITWLAGNFITGAFIVFSRVENTNFLAIPTIMLCLKASIQPVDWLLGFAAAYTAYFFGFKKVTPPQ